MGFSFHPGDVVDFAGQRIEITEVGNKLNEILVIVLMCVLWLHLNFSTFVIISIRQDNYLPFSLTQSFTCRKQRQWTFRGTR